MLVLLSRDSCDGCQSGPGGQSRPLTGEAADDTSSTGYLHRGETKFEE